MLVRLCLFGRTEPIISVLKTVKARAGRWIRAVVGKVVGSSQVVRHVAVSGYVPLLEADADGPAANSPGNASSALMEASKKLTAVLEIDVHRL